MSLFIAHNVTVMCSRLTVNDVEGSFSHFHFPPCSLFILTILLLTILPSENEVNEPVPSAPKKAIKTINRVSSKEKRNVLSLHLCATILNAVSENIIVLAPSKMDTAARAPVPLAPKKARKMVGQSSSKEMSRKVFSHLRVTVLNTFSDSENMIIPAPSVPTMARTPVIRTSSTKRPAANHSKGMHTLHSRSILSNTIQPMATMGIANPV